MNDIIKPTDTIPVGLPVLLRFARKTYSHAVQEALAAVGCEDMPKNGSYVLGGIANNDMPVRQLFVELGISKQAASQLIDTLVVRGYLLRTEDETDRRRLRLELTERSRLAARAIKKAIQKVDDELAAEVGEENLQATKYTLAVLIDIHDRRHGLPRGIQVKV